MQRIDAVVSRIVHSLGGTSGARGNPNNDQAILLIATADRVRGQLKVEQSSPAPNPNEHRLAQGNPGDLKVEAMADVTDDADGDCVKTHKPEGSIDKDLSGDFLKLIRYKVLFVKRGYEVAFPEQEEIVADNTTATEYIAWKVAQFVQQLDGVEVPSKWGKYEDDRPKYPAESKQIDSNGKKMWVINELPDDDKKYLRVFFEVLDRYPRQKFNYETRQIKVLEQIRDRLG